VDVDSDALRANATPEFAIQADSAEFLDALGAVVSESATGCAAARATEARNAIDEGRGAEERRHIAVLDVLRRVLPADGFVFSDMTQIAYTGNHAFPVEQPRCWFHPLGYGTLGYALPAAIGAKLAAPERAGVALAGDYGFQFTMQELSSAVELGLGLPILLWNNDGLGQIRDDMVASGIPEIGVNAHNPDFPALARACGCDAAAPDSLDALGDALSAALSATRPTLIEVRHDMPGL
jgi:thiamine pyrophosphate-dependent acetolactate synthase large subunit-like protein